MYDKDRQKAVFVIKSILQMLVNVLIYNATNDEKILVEE